MFLCSEPVDGSGGGFGRPEETDELTQDRLKQSCEQKNDLLLPSFRQAGHCKDPAGFAQATPTQ